MDYQRISLDEGHPDGPDRREDAAAAGLPPAPRPAPPAAAMDAAAFRSASGRILNAISTVIDGKAEAAKLALTVLLAQGH
ncbi:MAG: ATPase, partial [Arthrobacter sp.]